MIRKRNVLVVGGTSLDTIIQLHSPLAAGPQTLWAKDCYRAVGGTGAGKALNLSRLGFSVTLHTVLGDDPEAQEILSACEHPEIRILLERTAQPTEQHTNIMSPEGGRISIYTHPPDKPKAMDWSAVERALRETDIAAVSILDYTRPSLAMAKKLNKPLWIDLHDYDGKNPYHSDFVDAADVIFVAGDNLPDYRQFMLDQIALGKELVVCTHGREGSSALDKNGRWYDQGIIEGYELVDSNGAGDAFFSGFLYAHSRGADIQVCLAYGSVVAALCINSKHLYSEQLTPDYLEAVYCRHHG